MDAHLRHSYLPLIVIVTLAKRMFRLSLFALALLGGCNLPGTQQNKHDEMAVEYQYYGELLAALRTGPLHEAIAVGTITSHPTFAPRAPTRMDTARIRAAVEESLHRTELLATRGQARYQLDVELVQTKDQQVASDLVVNATIRYTLRNALHEAMRETMPETLPEAEGAIWYHDTLVSEYSIDLADESRLTAWELAYVGAVRNNLIALLRALSARE